MIFRLEYGNRFGDNSRIDITTPGLPTVVEIEGAGNPFRLKYTPDVSDKSFRFLTSSAEINIYETPEFNIDILKTSSETDIKVERYINGVKDWVGFVIPDFFSREIRGNAAVSMTASDRISTLKSVTLSDLPEFISIRELCAQCLAKTGLDLPIKTMCDFEWSPSGFNGLFRSQVLSQRLIDTKGRSISCYDTLGSILTANCMLLQRNGEWHIINKYQHEIGAGKLYSDESTSTDWVDTIFDFSEITKGAIETIIPVGASVGVYQELGGGRLHPSNYDFSRDLTGWNRNNNFNAPVKNEEVIGYIYGSNDFEFGEPTKKYFFANKNTWPFTTSGGQHVFNPNAPYLESDEIDIPYTVGDQINVDINMNVTTPPISIRPFIYFSVIATNGTDIYELGGSGNFDKVGSIGSNVLLRGPSGDAPFEIKTWSLNVKGLLKTPDGSLGGYKVKIRIYGSGNAVVTYMTLVHTCYISFTPNSSEMPKGNIYKTEQGSNYTKTHDIDTAIFGDYITGGLNGYFYDYPIDDTSSLYNSVGGMTSLWTAPNDSTPLPLLQHVSRQKARMFSVAHNLLRGDIEIVDFDPLYIFRDCDGKRYTLVSADVDFLNSNALLEIEEVAYGNISRRDFIYSYFGDGESGIKSVGGISGGGGGGGGSGGGLSPEQLEILSFWKKDPDNPNTIFTEMNAYSKLELSAYGVGDGGGGGGSDYERLDTWADYDSSKSGWVLSALLGNDLNTRVTNLENSGGGGGGGSTVEWGTLTNGYRQLTVEGVTYALAQNTHKHLWADITDKPSTFTPSAHSHGWSEITGKPSTFAPSAHSHGWSEITGKPSTFAPSAHSHGWSEITDKPSTFAPSAHSHGWSEITDKPSAFTPSAHTHSAGDITSGTFAIERIPTGTTGTTVALGNHLHTGVYEPVFSKNTAFNKNFGTASGTVAQGNDSRITNGQTAYGWGNHASAGYALNSALSNYLPLTGGTLTGNLTLPNLIADTSVKTPKISIGNNWSIELADTQLQFKYQGVIKHRYFIDGSFSAMGDVAAYSSGTEADELTLNKLVLLAGGGTTNRNITSTDSTIQINVGGVTALEATSLAVRRGTTASGVTLGTSTYRWSNVYGVDINASSNVTTPKITLGNGWTIEQTTASLTIRKDGVIKGTFNA